MDQSQRQMQRAVPAAKAALLRSKRRKLKDVGKMQEEKADIKKIIKHKRKKRIMKSRIVRKKRREMRERWRNEHWEGEAKMQRALAGMGFEEELRDFELDGDDGWKAGAGWDDTEHQHQVREEFEEMVEYDVMEEYEVEVEVEDDEEGAADTDDEERDMYVLSDDENK
ncbi:uncharacterized protein LY89DRAFT_663989 [Mollisia scopiformis]|uniref:Uncharacterized protein n=1 Tax=Mollisia scopiformis TaxID=149040 RepID=A0A194XTW4_MOLSC|nr:uncharacterized protein LY89DRAFT_663989 [Mollisia scopiformis]KUJ23581.1 hypothetical protein LY89DRAFT_663989 [Mollisia scopiformis]